MFPHRTSISLCIAALLLAGCSSGGGTKSPPPAPATAPPVPPVIPPPPVISPCQPTADCVLRYDGTNVTSYFAPGITSDYALVKQDDHGVYLRGVFEFQGGTRIESGSIWLELGTTLRSDTEVLPSGGLGILGTLEGDLLNNSTGVPRRYDGSDAPGTAYIEGGGVHLFGIVRGDVLNNGPLTISGDPHYAGATPSARIEGDFRQTTSGILGISLPSGERGANDPPSIPGRIGSYPLWITGNAVLEGGSLWLYRECNCWDYGPEPLPTRPVAVHVLHADGGVTGQFDDWISPGLFIEGSVRYEPADVWFDLARASVATTMAAQSASGLAMIAARNFDSALARTDGRARTPPPSMDTAQRQFLASASSLLWMQDAGEAARALESLTGHAHASMAALVHEQAAGTAAQTASRLADLAYSPQTTAWSAATAGMGPGAGGLASGFDQWLSPRLLVGAGVGSGDAGRQFDRLGGQLQGEAPLASLYAHYRGDGWHATGLAGAGRATLRLQRPILVGAAGAHLAHSQRSLEHSFVHAEFGRDVETGAGRFSPFAAFDYTRLRSAGFAEQGDSGFELVGARWNQARVSAATGARYSRAWAVGGHALRLDAEANYRHLLAAGDPLRAAFRGVPDLWFDVPAAADGDGYAELRLGLAGASGRQWGWSMDYTRTGGLGGGEVFRLQVQRGF